jgi:hypothetical protein
LRWIGGFAGLVVGGTLLVGAAASLVTRSPELRSRLAVLFGINAGYMSLVIWFVWIAAWLLISGRDT